MRKLNLDDFSQVSARAESNNVFPLIRNDIA